MTALQTATNLLREAESQYDQSERGDGNPYWRGRSERSYQEAAIYAAVAQAEALDRIAAALEVMTRDGIATFKP